MPVNDLVVGGYGNVSYTLHWNRAPMCAGAIINARIPKSFLWGKR